MGKRARRGRGEGSVYQEPDGGRWTGVLSQGYTAAGKRRRKKVHGKTKAEVVEKLAALRGKAGEGEPCKLTVEAYLAQWLTNAADRLRPSSQQRYQEVIRGQVTPYLGHVRLAQLTPLAIETYYSEMARKGVSAAGRLMAARVLNAALRAAVRLGLIVSNPAAAAHKPKVVAREMVVLTVAEVRAFLDAARSSKYFALFLLAVTTGLRRGELLGLDWANVDFERGTVTVRRTLTRVGKEFRLASPKTRSSQRTLTVPPLAMTALHEHRKEMVVAGHASSLVFCTRSGRPLWGSNLLNKSFYPVLRRAGLSRVPFHALRHAHASHLLSGGQSIRAVAARLGHSNAAITLKVYAHALPTDDARLAAAAQDLYAAG